MSSEVPSHGCCPSCNGHHLTYAFGTSTGTFFKCEGCRIFVCSQTASQIENKIQSFWSDEERASHRSLNDEEQKNYFDLIPQPYENKKLLEIGCQDGTFLLEARKRGLQVAGFEGNKSAAKLAAERLGPDVVTYANSLEGIYSPKSFDIIVLFDLLGTFTDPMAVLRQIRTLLQDDGIFLFCIPVTDSRPAMLLRHNWVEFHKDQSILFDTNNIQNALFLTGFDRTLVLKHSREVSLRWLRNYLSQFKLHGSLRLLMALVPILPPPLRTLSLKVKGGHAVIITRAQPQAPQRTVSIVIPVYNEKSTFRELMEGVLNKKLPGLKKEIILVESNSTDGSRDEVLRYHGYSDVRILLQDKPRGKGNAVREGLAHATGDFVLIQDADLEYDLDDYDSLLEPLRTGREALVLGSRHGGRNPWKMREFDQQKTLSAVFNIGHVFFATLVNVLFLQKMDDPFTMYKVFRRDCLYGLEFECNRFDFDYELLVKMILKGYQPVELPVNYRSRSFVEGKKIRAFYDSMTWLRILIKLRLTRIDLLQIARRAAKPKPDVEP